MSTSRVIGWLSLLSVLGGCAHVDGDSAQLYYFNHSVLNFERRPLYPRQFELPPPLESESRGSAVAARKPRQTDEARSAEEQVAASGPGRRGAEPWAGKTHEANGPETAMPAAVVKPAEPPAQPSAQVDKAKRPELPPLAVEAAERAQKRRPAAATGVRLEVLAAAERVVGIRSDFDGGSFIAHVLKVSAVEVPVTYGDDYIRDLYKHLKASGLTYDREAPLPGDLVFFHNTADRNGDGRNNDWYSLCGVVKEIDEDGTVHLITVVREEVQELVMNLGRPEVRRDERTATYLNSFLRSKSLADPEYTQYLAGELYAGFASVAFP